MHHFVLKVNDSSFCPFIYQQTFNKLTELIEELVANRSPIDSHV